MEWKEEQIHDVCRLINGRAYSNDEMLEKGKYKIVRVGNLSGGNSTWFYSNLELPKDKYCHTGDLLLHGLVLLVRIFGKKTILFSIIIYGKLM